MGTRDATRFAASLRAALNANEMSAGDLAARMDVHPSQVSHWLTGRRSPSLENLIAVADAIGCSLDDLVGRTVGEVERLYVFEVSICRGCVLGVGWECHSPGCLLFLRDVRGPLVELVGQHEDLDGPLETAVRERYSGKSGLD